MLQLRLNGSFSSQNYATFSFAAFRADATAANDVLDVEAVVGVALTVKAAVVVTADAEESHPLTAVVEGPATGAAVTAAGILSAVAAVEGASGLVVVCPDVVEAFGTEGLDVEATVVEGFLSATHCERRKQTKNISDHFGK